MIDAKDRAFLTKLFEAAISAADPKKAIGKHLPEKPPGKTVVVGAGKGAAQMAAAFEDLWGEPIEGVVVTSYGYGGPTKHIKIMEASHPVPDHAGLAASKALFDMVGGLSADDLVIALICGGGSALLPSPADGLTFEDEKLLNEALLKSGAPISVMNAIRNQISTIKGGRLAKAAYPARVISLVVSDVPGDNPAQVASGPTVPDTVTLEQVMGYIDSYRIGLPTHICSFIEHGANEPPKPTDADFASNEVHVIASASISLEAAAGAAKNMGVTPIILSDSIEGEARDVGMMHASIAREVALRDRPFSKPAVILSGGETTVTIRDKAGRGGRNTECLLALAGGIEGLNLTAFAADTDGIDGSEANAGAFANGQTWARLREADQDPSALLSNHDAWSAFDMLGDLFSPGPTGTNVNDLRAMLIR